MKIIGIRPSSFTGSDGSKVEGQNIYLTYDLDKGEGQGSDRVFVTKAKLADWSYKPKVGDDVDVSYNRYGKCAGMSKAGLKLPR